MGLKNFLKKSITVMRAPLDGARLGVLVVGAMALSSLSGCISTEQAANLGAREHPKIVQQYGGGTKNPALNGYVTRVGQKLAANSNYPPNYYTFTLLDTPVVNAFALPGGYVYVTRGILAMSNSEAELAGVMGHEIGHITGEHTAKRYNQSVLAGIGSLGVGILTGSDQWARVAQQGSQLYLLSYSRDQEYESDSYGIRYLTSAGLEPYAMGDFLGQLQRQHELSATVYGQNYDPNRVDFFSTHPNTADRVQRAYAIAGKQNAGQRGTLPENRNAFLRTIDGMLYGDSPEQGYIRGRRFSHGQLRFTFEVPQGYQLSNSPTVLVAKGPSGAGLQFDMAKDYQSGMSVGQYVTNRFAPSLKIQVGNVQTSRVNGMNVASGQARANTSNGAVDVRLVAVQYDASKVYRFLIVTPTKATGSLSSGLNKMIGSFRKLSSSEASKLKPQRIKVITVQRGDTVTSVSRRMAFSDHRVERFRALNGLSPNDGLQAGQLVKIVVE